MDLYFSDYFDVAPETLEDFGAFDISVVSDLPLFVDPFLLFHSSNEEYQELHAEILRYLRFLRDQSGPGLDKGLIRNWYRFKEVKQNWLGYTQFGNGGQGLGAKFAVALHANLSGILSGFGDETITHGSHLEKLCLMQPGVGKDNISDFTTNLIKGYLCRYTQDFATEHLEPDRCDSFAVPRAWFNYDTHTWVTERYTLPRLRDDFVLLTPADMLTRDDTWISYAGMLAKFALLPDAISNEEQRAQINQYFARALGEDPDASRIRAAAAATIRKFPELIDLYIRLQEEDGERAETTSADKVDSTRRELVEQIRQVLDDLQGRTDFFAKPWTTYAECLARARYFKHYIEHNDGYLLFNRGGRPPSNEKDVQLAFGLVWGGTELDVNREVNNGRGPVDFKASYGAGDTALIEFKLGSNKQLKTNLLKQVAIYQDANRTRSAVKVIVYYTEADETRVKSILADLELENEESIVLIDARADNKPSASKAK